MEPQDQETAAIKAELLELQAELAALKAAPRPKRGSPGASKLRHLRALVVRHPLAAMAIAFIVGMSLGRMEGA